MNMMRTGSSRKRIDLRKAKKPVLVIPDANDEESGSKPTLETSSKDKVLKKVFLPKKVSICPNCKVSVNISESGKSLESDWFCKRCAKEKRQEERRQREWENAERICRKQKSNGAGGSHEQGNSKNSVSV